jgi:Asp-tRNA(Asn)/Glu-tRNA(Gln) amidotransferase A subunit family amidase
MDGRVSRRSFLRYTTATGAAATAATAAGAAPALAAEGHDQVPSFKWEAATIAELQAAMAAGRLTSRELTRAYLRRIRQIDHSGIQLNSVIQVNQDALGIAGSLDRERRRHGARGPLHGIPILVKDNFATDDRMQTTAGSLALLGSRVPRDAFVVAGLRRAGAVILGKLNLSEWANFRSLQSSSGWSGRAGQCLNPYVLDHNPCGSSSGSGIAAAASLAAGTLGTETDGSIVCPSATCGIVGIKPTLGLTSRSGVVPLAHSQDVTGPMCRTVADAATAFGPELTVLLFEFKADIAAYLSELRNTSMRTLADLIAFNDANAERELRWFGQEIFLLAEATTGLDDPAYLDALATSKRLMQDGIDQTMDRFDLDAIVSLTGSPSWTTDLINGDHFLTASSTPSAVAGYPSITVPAGFSFDELPVGISLIGRRWGEPTLIKLAYGFEQGTRVRHAPRFLPTLAVKDVIPRDTGTARRPAGAAGRAGGRERDRSGTQARPDGKRMAGRL